MKKEGKTKTVHNDYGPKSPLVKFILLTLVAFRGVIYVHLAKRDASAKTRWRSITQLANLSIEPQLTYSKQFKDTIAVA